MRVSVDSPVLLPLLVKTLNCDYHVDTRCVLMLFVLRFGYAVLGVGCKMFSILLNEMFVEATNNPNRLLVLAFAVLSSAMYQQAPKRIATKLANPQATV